MKRVPLDPDLDPYALFAASRDAHPHAFLLESLTGPERLREYTFIGFDPEMTISYRGGVLRTNWDTTKTDRPFEALRRILEEHATPDVPGPFVGGLVGYVSFEFVRHLDRVPVHLTSPFPECEFGLYLAGVIVDHRRRKAEYFTHGASRATALPLAVGFGVSTPDHVRTLASLGADGIVVGSAIVRQEAQDPDPRAVEPFVRELASGLRP